MKLPIRIEGIQAILSVKDMAASRAFYVGILGFKEEDWGDDDFTSIRYEGAPCSAIYLCRGAQGQPGTWLWIGFDGDIFDLHDRLKRKCVTIRQPPVNYPFAMELRIEDPDGHVLRFGTDPDESQPFVTL